jgi:hypothetical protein
VCSQGRLRATYNRHDCSEHDRRTQLSFTIKTLGEIEVAATGHGRDHAGTDRATDMDGETE